MQKLDELFKSKPWVTPSMVAGSSEEVPCFDRASKLILNKQLNKLEIITNLNIQKFNFRIWWTIERFGKNIQGKSN